MNPNTLRIILTIVGLLVLALIYWSGSRSGKPQGRRVGGRSSSERSEPQVGDLRIDDPHELDPDIAAELVRLGREINGRDDDARDPQSFATPEPIATTAPDAVSDAAVEAPVAPMPVYVESNVGARSSERNDRIVTVFVAANEGQNFAGSDIIVAAEKTGLIYGHLGIFHRMPATRSEYGAVFSVANMVRPGRFEMSQIQSLRSPGLSLFLVLPNALSALDAWDAMLPTAQRLAELLGGQVLDEERNALGRQRIQHIRDELRAYDRAQEKNTIKRSW